MNEQINFWAISMEALLRPGVIESVIGGMILAVGIKLDYKRFIMLIVLVNLLVALAILGAK